MILLAKFQVKWLTFGCTTNVLLVSKMSHSTSYFGNLFKIILDKLS